MPVYAAIFGFFVLAILGLPGLAGFVGEFLVIVGAFDFWPVVAAVTALAMMLGAAYLLWMYQRVVFGDLSDFLKGIGHHLTDMSRVEVADARAARRPDPGLRRLPRPAARRSGRRP